MPPRNATKSNYGPRLYPWPPPPAEPEMWVPSVTSVLGVLDKPAIANWKVDRAARAAILMAKSGALAALISQDETMAMSAIKSGWKSELDAAGAAGTAVHEAFEAHIKQTPAPKLNELTTQIYKQLLGLVNMYDVRVIHSECTVYGLASGLEWAGTLDMIVDMDIPGRARKTLVADIKTSKGVYDDMAWQIGGAYRGSDVLVTGDDGTVIPMPHTDGAIIFHVRPDEARAIPLASDALLYEGFLAARRIWGLKHDKSRRDVFAPLPVMKRN